MHRLLSFPKGCIENKDMSDPLKITISDPVTGVNPLHIVHGEIYVVVSNMRRNARWASLHNLGEEDPLLQNFKQLKTILANTKAIEDVDAMQLVNPFLEVITRDTTSGPITGVALASINKFLLYHILERSKNLNRTIVNIASAVTCTRFVLSDVDSDEVVLMMLLQTLRTILLLPVGNCLPDEAVCDVIQAVFRISCRARLSTLLRKTAEQTLFDIVVRLYSRLNEFSEDDDVELGTHDLLPRTASFLLEDPVIENARVPSQDDLSPMKSEEDMNKEEEEEKGSEATDDKWEEKELLEGSPMDSNEKERTKVALAREATVWGADQSLVASDESEEIEPKAPYGLASLKELFRLLTSMCICSDQNNTDAIIRTGITLLTTAMEIGGPSFPRFPSLMSLIENEMCRNMFDVAKTDSLQLFTLSLRLGLLTFVTLRSHLKFQMERFLDLLMLHIDQVHYSPEHQEMALDIILQLCREPGLVVELYVNYDCNLFCSDLCERLMKFLSEHSFANSGQLLSTHMLALEALFCVVDAIQLRCDMTAPHTPPTDRQGHENGFQSRQSSSVPSFLESDIKNSSLSVPTSPSVFSVMRHANSMSSLAGHKGSGALKGKVMNNKLLSPASLRELRRNKQLLLEACTLFNEKPSKGVQFLQEQAMIPSPPLPYEDELVVFLRSSPQLDKAKVGEFIGRPDQVAVLTAYTSTIHMTDERIDNSLRDFLEGFRLPGEAQIIFRIMEAFADQYHRANPSVADDTDSIFVLAYAIIMLNVDQHNPRVKKRMTVEDFIKNQRGLNAGKDFSKEFLSEIYQSIKTNEIIMPDEAVGATYDNYFWSEMLKKGYNPLYGDYISTCSADYDHDMFQVIWGPAVAAISYIFDTAQNEVVVQRAIQGFKQCATLAAHFQLKEVFDKMVISLSNFTGLETPNEEDGKKELSLAVQFGLNYKAQLAAITMFSLARENGDMLSEGWKNVFECMRKLFQAKLLPASMLKLEDRVDTRGFIVLQEPKIAKTQSKDSWSLSGLAAWMIYSEPEPNQVAPRELEAEGHARECIANCQLPDIFEQSKNLKLDTLIYLTRALVHTSQFKQSQQSNEYMDCRPHNELNEEAALFFLENLVNVTLSNKDRIYHLWHISTGHIKSILTSDPTHIMATRGVVGLFRLCTHLYHQSDVSNEIIRCMISSVTSVQNNHDLAISTAPYVLAGLEMFIQENCNYVQTPNEWESVLTLFVNTAPSQLEKANAILSNLVNNHINSVNFLPLVRALHRLIITAAPEQARTKRGRHVSTTNKTSHAGTFLNETIGLIFTLHLAAPSLCKDLNDTKPIRDVWTWYWSPLLHILCDLGCNVRSDVRTTAITYLERALTLDCMTPSEWECALKEVVFPMLQSLLAADLDLQDGRGVDETRFRMVGLVCKVIRQHRIALLAMNDFPAVWVQTLELIGQYMYANNSEYLLESVPESLKITLLVLSSSGILRDPMTAEDQQSPVPPPPLTVSKAIDLWTLTWVTVGKFLPSMKEELFPALPPSPPTSPTSTSTSIPTHYTLPPNENTQPTPLLNHRSIDTMEDDAINIPAIDRAESTNQSTFSQVVISSANQSEPVLHTHTPSITPSKLPNMETPTTNENTRSPNSGLVQYVYDV